MWRAYKVIRRSSSGIGLKERKFLLDYKATPQEDVARMRKGKAYGNQVAPGLKGSARRPAFYWSDIN